TKGVYLLLELARLEPELQVTLVWRPFSKESEKALALVRRHQLSNVHILCGRIAQMHQLYGQHHFTIAPFVNVGKPCPNSVLEGLACGRPALVSKYVDVGGVLEREGAGLTFAGAAH